MMPASLYSTACVMELPVLPPADTGTCCDVTMGTDCETLMTAFLFSLVMMDGLESGWNPPDMVGHDRHPRRPAACCDVRCRGQRGVYLHQQRYEPLASAYEALRLAETLGHALTSVNALWITIYHRGEG